MITFDEDKQIFHLTNNRISYLIQIKPGGYLAHIYFGKKIAHYSSSYDYPQVDRSFSPNPPHAVDRGFSLDTLLQEYPGHGFGDFREPAYNIRLNDGSRVTDFRYHDYQIRPGKPQLAGLPATYVSDEHDAQTLVLHLLDQVSQLELKMYYTIFTKQNVITRSAKLTNHGNDTVEVNRLTSVAIDFPAASYDLIQLRGAWARERNIVREPLNLGIKVLDSKRGASGHQQNPFVALVQPETTEFQGEAIGFGLIYSGNHETIIQRDQYAQTRVLMGINSFNFAWQLQPETAFQTPEVVLVYSDAGLNAMSQTFHDLCNQHLVPRRFQQRQRPILINNWEATYFNFDENKILKLAQAAKEVGIELFVLDDGWFGARNDDRTSLGDWFENKAKLSHGVSGLSAQIHQMGLQFGIWFEPEMISEDSDLFRNHPDWVLEVPRRERSVGRNQYVLDFSRAEVRANIFKQMTTILDQANLDYIKWDMNRNMTEVYSQVLPALQQGEVAHRYILGLYDFLSKITQAYPQVLFEGCAGGGGRFDLGILYYLPQSWTSDNTDAISRIKVQYGTSLLYPISSMGAHVSAVPNEQTHRVTSLAIRGNVAMSGVLGYELDLTKATADEKQAIAEQIKFYKAHRQLLQFGKFYRLMSPFNHNDVAWMFVSEQQDEAIVFYFRMSAEASYPLVTLKLAGLDPAKHYRLGNAVYGGDELMNIGLYVDPNLTGDYATQRYVIKAIED
ncbi:alpha-galactosidase [Lapidilactobacillus bayanensis]|uniref:alpha-galactosidase n=1 Tax=Lapidilactobacillus bayanensis TaxID=2485998 RepID=UPI000F7981A9|nr:alpha-galactosidase [Lapidilactobacillus bayanensis]